MTIQRLITSEVPADTENNDGGAAGITTATAIRFDAAGYSITHVQFWATDTVSGDYTAAVWQVTGPSSAPSGTLLASVDLTAAQVSPGLNEVALDTPVPVTPTTVLYAAGVWNSEGRYVFTNGFFSASGLTKGDVYALEDGESFPGIGGIRNGSFRLNSAFGYPDDFPGNGSFYFVGLVFSDETAPAEGSADLGLNLAVASTGAASAEGSASLGIGLAVAAQGAAPAEGTVALGLGLAVAVSGARDSLGAAALGLGLNVVSAGERASLGASVLGLNLAMAAHGTNGESGRPVSSFPWPPRPVKSFREVTG